MLQSVEGVWQFNSIPDGQHSAVSVGGSHSCGLRADGTVECWGSDDAEGRLDAPNGPFIAVAAGGAHTCALRADGMIECWGTARPPPSGVVFSP